jgi:short-subunit dehydrogenase
VASNVFYYKCDVTNSTELHSLAETIRTTHGEPTVLINNAGIHIGKSIFEETEEEIRRIFSVNTMAHWFTAKEFAPAMVKANHGHIVTIASMASFVCFAGMVDYCATKASALAFHEGLAGELRWFHDALNVRTT